MLICFCPIWINMWSTRFWWLVVLLLLCTLTGVNGKPRGSGGTSPNDDQRRELLRVRLSGDRGGAAGRAELKTMAKRNSIFLTPTELPQPLSDHAVSLYNGKIYISGGCDSSSGNQYDPDSGSFRCLGVSSRFYLFEPLVDYGRGRYEILADLPKPRHRHTSVVMKGQIWLLGGRDDDDKLVDTVDVYDIATGTWSSLVLPPPFRTSDHGSFVHKNYIFLAGGYDQEYNPKKSVYRLDTTTYWIEDAASLQLARAGAATTQTSEFAYMVGGYSQDCATSNAVERFDFASGEWTTLASSLVHARASACLATVKGLVVILGGLSGSCRASSNPELASDAVTMNTVEVLGHSGWLTVNATMQDPLHAFSTVALEKTAAIYSFGGQGPYNPTCQCFPTTAEVVSYSLLYEAAKNLVPTLPTNAPTPFVDPNVTVLPSTNDRCHDAVDLAVVPAGLGRFAPVFGSTMGATIDSSSPSCSGVAVNQPSVWFRVLGEQGTMTAQTCGSYTNFDSIVTIYRGTCEDLVCVAANDDGCGGNRARVQWEAERGVVYFVLVHGWVDHPVGNYELSISVREPPNDACEEAQGPLTIGSSADGSTLYASLDGDSFSGVSPKLCSGFSYGAVPGVWYTVLGTGKTIVAHTCHDRTDYDTLIHVFTGDCTSSRGGGLKCVQGNGKSADCGSLTRPQSIVRWKSTVGVKYWIYVHGFQGRSSQGYFVLTIDEED